MPALPGQTKGNVEGGVKYVRRNMWPSMRFTDDADLNRQGLEWCDVVANRRIHGMSLFRNGSVKKVDLRRQCDRRI